MKIALRSFAQIKPIREKRGAPLHCRLGIRTEVHLQAVTDYVGGFDKRTGQYWSPHQYRARITLSRVA
jgi:hypothetical protein